MLIHDKFYCKGNSNYLKFSNITEKLTKRQSIEFALYCAKDVFHLVEEQDKKVVKRCIDLVEKWLKDENSVTSKDLRKASAARVAYAAHASTNAANVTNVAIRAVANISANTSYAAAHAAYYATAANTNKLDEYFVVANSYLTKTNVNCLNYELEGKILYLIDELEENIIVHKDKYYANMNGIERCPEYGFDSQEELLNELLYSEDGFWAFARNWLDQLYKEESNVDS